MASRGVRRCLAAPVSLPRPGGVKRHRPVACRPLRTGYDAGGPDRRRAPPPPAPGRSEEHTSELQSQSNLVCRLLLEKKKKKKKKHHLKKIKETTTNTHPRTLHALVQYPTSHSSAKLNTIIRLIVLPS